MTTKSPITVVVDSTGLTTTTTKGSYIEDKWKKEKRKYLKLHIMADKETKKIVGFRVTSEHTGRFEKVLAPLVKEASKTNKIKKAYADHTAYDSRKNFNVLKEKGIESLQSRSERMQGHAVQRLSPS
jgi:uncharacterized iron-regulated protein